MGVSTTARKSFLLFWELSCCRERWLRPLAEEAETSLPTEPDPETWYYQGTIFAFCGKKQAALHLLQSAVEHNYCARENLLYDPLLAKLRTDKAFDKLLTAAGACQEAVRAETNQSSH